MPSHAHLMCGLAQAACRRCASDLAALLQLCYTPGEAARGACLPLQSLLTLATVAEARSSFFELLGRGRASPGTEARGSCRRKLVVRVQQSGMRC